MTSGARPPFPRLAWWAEHLAARPDWAASRPALLDLMPLPIEWSCGAVTAERLRSGFRPSSMDDKWLIVPDGDTLTFYRSWTGEWSMEWRFAHGPGGALVVVGGWMAAALVPWWPPVYAADCSRYLVERLVLNRPADAPSRPTSAGASGTG